MHVWETQSRHRTSEGVVSYQRCSCTCGTWRVLVGPASVATIDQPTDGHADTDEDWGRTRSSRRDAWRQARAVYLLRAPSHGLTASGPR